MDYHYYQYVYYHCYAFYCIMCIIITIIIIIIIIIYYLAASSARDARRRSKGGIRKAGSDQTINCISVFDSLNLCQSGDFVSMNFGGNTLSTRWDYSPEVEIHYIRTTFVSHLKGAFLLDPPLRIIRPSNYLRVTFVCRLKGGLFVGSPFSDPPFWGTR